MDNCKNCNVKTTLILWMKYYAMLGKQHGDIFKKLTKTRKLIISLSVIYFPASSWWSTRSADKKNKVIYFSLA